MPRDLPLGNGTLLVTFDSLYQLRDVYFPFVGQENHTLGGPCRFGVWADGLFSWAADDGWQRSITYASETLVGDTTLEHAALGVRLRCRDAVDFDRNVLAEHHVEVARTPSDLARPLDPYTGEPLSVSPLTWSHAGVVAAVQRYARKAEGVDEAARARFTRAGELIR